MHILLFIICLIGDYQTSRGKECHAVRHTYHPFLCMLALNYLVGLHWFDKAEHDINSLLGLFGEIVHDFVILVIQYLNITYNKEGDSGFGECVHLFLFYAACTSVSITRVGWTWENYHRFVWSWQERYKTQGSLTREAQLLCLGLMKNNN